MTGLVPIPPSMDETVAFGETIVFSDRDGDWQVEADLLDGAQRYDEQGVSEAISDHLAHPDE